MANLNNYIFFKLDRYGTAELCYAQVKLFTSLLISLPSSSSAAYTHLCVLMRRLVPLLKLDDQVRFCTHWVFVLFCSCLCFRLVGWSVYSHLINQSFIKQQTDSVIFRLNCKKMFIIPFQHSSVQLKVETNYYTLTLILINTLDINQLGYKSILYLLTLTPPPAFLAEKTGEKNMVFRRDLNHRPLTH